MKTLVITPKDQAEFKFVSELLRKLGVRVNTLTREEKEDLGLAIFMNEVDRSKKASRDVIMRKLNAK